MMSSNRTTPDRTVESTGEVCTDTPLRHDRLDRLREEKKQLTKRIDEMYGGEDIDDLIARARELKKEIGRLEAAQETAETQTETDNSENQEGASQDAMQAFSRIQESPSASGRSPSVKIVDTDWADWDECLFAKHGSAYHSSKWAQLRMACGDETSFRIGLTDGDQLVRPLALATLHSGRLSRTLKVEGAIETQDPEELAAALELILCIAREERCLEVTIEGRDYLPEQPSLDEFGFEIARTTEILVPCDRSLDALWAAIHRQSRKNVRRARREGFEVEEESTAESVDIAARLDETLRDANIEKGARYGDLSRDEYRAIWEALGPSGDVRFLIARLNGEPVGSFMLLTWGTRVHAWRAGYTLEARRGGVSALLYWQTLKLTCRENYDMLNLGSMPPGAEEPRSQHHGLYRFKTRWDSHIIPRESGTMVLRPLLHGVRGAIGALRDR